MKNTATQQKQTTLKAIKCPSTFYQPVKSLLSTKRYHQQTFIEISRIYSLQAVVRYSFSCNTSLFWACEAAEIFITFCYFQSSCPSCVIKKWIREWASWESILPGTRKVEGVAQFHSWLFKHYYFTTFILIDQKTISALLWKVVHRCPLLSSGHHVYSLALIFKEMIAPKPQVTTKNNLSWDIQCLPNWIGTADLCRAIFWKIADQAQDALPLLMTNKGLSACKIEYIHIYIQSPSQSLQI